MKKRIALIASAMTFCANVAMAEIVTVDISATVTNVSDPDNAMSGQMQLGAVISGTYTYDTSLVDMDSSPQFGIYEHTAGAGGFALSAGGLSLETNNTGMPGDYGIHVSNDISDMYHVMSSRNKPLPNGAQIDYMAMDLYGGTGAALSSDALLLSPPNVAAFDEHFIHGHGVSANGVGFYFEMEVNSLTLPGGSDGSMPSGTYDLVAVVRDVYDPENSLQGQVISGMEISGSYTIDLNAVDQDPYSNYGRYEIPASSEYGFQLQLGSIGFSSSTSPNAYPREVMIQNDVWDSYGVIGGSGLATGADVNVDFINMFLDDPSGLALNSDALVADAPNLAAFTGYRDLIIGGYSTSTGQYFHIVAEVRSIKTDEAPAVILSPADGSAFIMGQYADMALILPSQWQPNAWAVSGTLNGMPIDHFFARCMPGSIMMSGQDTLLCPDIKSILQPGANNLQIDVMNKDGTLHNIKPVWYLYD